MTWLPLIPIAIGAVLVTEARALDRTSSFENGTFTAEMAAAVTGIALIAVGVVAFPILYFVT